MLGGVDVAAICISGIEIDATRIFTDSIDVPSSIVAPKLGTVLDRALFRGNFFGDPYRLAGAGERADARRDGPAWANADQRAE